MVTSSHPPTPRRSRVPVTVKAAALAVTSALVFAGSVLAIPLWSSGASAATAAQSPWSFPGRGATVPFAEVEAEDAATNGTVIGPDRVYTHLPSEASGRRAVTLNGAGKYVEFTVPKAANAMSVRYSVPDSSNGTGLTTPVDLLVNGSKLKDLSLTSKYSWYYGGYPFSNNPGDGNPHHFYDETRTMFGSTLAQGAKVRIQLSSGGPVTIDLADFESVPAPIAQPAGSLSVDSYGASKNSADRLHRRLPGRRGRGQGAEQGRLHPPGHLHAVRPRDRRRRHARRRRPLVQRAHRPRPEQPQPRRRDLRQVRLRRRAEPERQPQGLRHHRRDHRAGRRRPGQRPGRGDEQLHRR